MSDAPTAIPAHQTTLPSRAWIKCAIVGALFVLLFWTPCLRRLWDKTNPFYGEPNWAHGALIPLVGLYYLYVNRDALLNPQPLPRIRPRRSALWVWGMFLGALLLLLGLVDQLAQDQFNHAQLAAAGLAAVSLLICLAWPTSAPMRLIRAYSAEIFGGFLIIFGVALLRYAIYPIQNDFLKDVAMVLALFGIVLALVGWPTMRIAWFPVAFLFCALPWPPLLYSQLASHLQVLAANVAVWTLQITGVPAEVGGTRILIPDSSGMHALNVAEACAGLRSLMTFISLAATVAFLSSRTFWQKCVVVASAVPIAIFCNVVRVSGQGLLDHYVSRQLSEDFAHKFIGMIMMIPAFLLILLVTWILDRIFVEQVDRRLTVADPQILSRASSASPVVPPNVTRRSLAQIRAEATQKRHAPVPDAGRNGNEDIP